jgi:hypothetical protein
LEKALEKAVAYLYNEAVQNSSFWGNFPGFRGKTGLFPVFHGEKNL